jgi:hypothetical protein
MAFPVLTPRVPPPAEPAKPYCSNCGYDLTGATSTPSCPECGRPLVEVLQRRGPGQPAAKRYRTDAAWMGWPLVDVAFGPLPGESMGRARGVIAVGDDAVGLIAIGGIARGGLAVGGLALGVVSMGGLAIGGVAAAGGMAVAGGAAFGGFAVAGGIAFGGLAIGRVPWGGLPVRLW